MWRFVLLLLLLVGCTTGKDTYDWHINDRARFMNENRKAVRVLKIDDNGYERRVEVEGLITKEKTWAVFNKDQVPKEGEIWRVGPVTDGKIAWFRLSYIQPTLED